MAITKAAETCAFSHSTSKDALRNILETGWLMPLGTLARVAPETQISAEVNAFNRKRGSMTAAELAAVQKQRGKDPSRLFLVRDKVLPSYGQYTIVKQLASPQLHTRLNCIPDEYVTGRSLSIRSNAQVFVPDEEVDALRQEFSGLGRIIQPRSALSLTEARAYHLPRTWLQKATHGVLRKFAQEHTPFTDSNRLRPTQLRKHLGRNAILVGSSALGTSVDDSDVDIFLPVARQRDFEKKKLLAQHLFPTLCPSERNTQKPNRYLLTGKVGDREVDVVIGHGDTPRAFHAAFLRAKRGLTPERQREIRERKQELKNSWFFPETRYKNYKKRVAQELGLAQHYF